MDLIRRCNNYGKWSLNDSCARWRLHCMAFSFSKCSKPLLGWMMCNIKVTPDECVEILKYLSSRVNTRDFEPYENCKVSNSWITEIC